MTCRRHKKALAIVLIAGMMIMLTAWACWRVPRSEAFLWPRASFASIDQWHTSPLTHGSVRVLITDRGALGYGGIFVYQWSALNGYGLLWKDAPAIASPEHYSIRWINENEIDLRYTNPNNGQVLKRLKLD